MNLEFSTAIAHQLDDEEADAEQPVRTTSITIDGEVHVVYEPSPSLMTVVGAAMSGSGVEITRGVWDFFRATLEPAAFEKLRTAAVAQGAGIPIERLILLQTQIMEEFAGFPTQSSRASSGTPTRTGSRSTGRAPGPGSTRSS